MSTVRGKTLLIACALIANWVAAQPGCSPATTNGSCAAAASLTVNSACINGTTCGGGAQSASSCLFAGSQCSWYSFTATATSMYVNIDLTATDGCHLSSNVYRATGPCAGLTQVSCLAGAPIDDMHALTGLTVGALYYVQVCYSPGGPCGNNGSAEYCIRVGVPDAPCNTCNTPCGDAYGYTSTPSVAQVVADCQSAPFGPPLQPGAAHTFCNSFTATNTTVSFNVVITSDCGAGNVTNFTWALYNSPSCGGAIQTGTLANLNFTGLTIGSTYVYCYSFNVPASCTHVQHCPYFVGATVPLPVTWLGLDARTDDQDHVILEWATATESNTSHFAVERSQDALLFAEVGRVAAAGYSNMVTHYRYVDMHPFTGVSYYRLKQTDNDEAFTYTNMVAVEVGGMLQHAVVIPDPGGGDEILLFEARTEEQLLIRMYDPFGRVVSSRTIRTVHGRNSIGLRTGELASGVYTISLDMDVHLEVLRFVLD